MPTVALSAFRYLIAAAYTFGGAVHVANLLGFGPPPPPEKRAVYRKLDVAYIVVNLLVIVGMITGSVWGYVAFFTAVASQLVLYVGFTDYFASDDDERRQLRGMVGFHLVTAAAMTALLILT